MKPATPWHSLGGKVGSSAAVASWGDFEVEVFAIHNDGQLWNRYWDGESWHEWKPMGGSFSGQPGAAARDPDRIDVMAIDTDGVVQHCYWDGSEWVAWRALEGAPEGAAAVSCSWTGARLDVFVTAADGSVWYTALTP